MAMGLESPVNYIDDLDPLNPLGGDQKSQGDNHIRNIKTALQGSFPSLGSSAVTASAADLNKVAAANIESEFVLSFGPSGSPRYGDVEPAAGDYSLDMLSDVDTTTSSPADYDLLGWNDTNSEWEPKAGAQTLHALYYGNGGLVGNRHYFTSSYYDTIDGVLADITNSGVGGFILEALETIHVTISFSLDMTASGGTIALRAEIARNQTGTSVPSGAELLAKSRITTANGAEASPSCSASIRLTAGDTITLCRNSASITTSDARAAITAVRCE